MIITYNLNENSRVLDFGNTTYGIPKVRHLMSFIQDSSAAVAQCRGAVVCGATVPGAGHWECPSQVQMAECLYIEYPLHRKIIIPSDLNVHFGIIWP